MSEEENKVLEYFKNNQVFDIEVAFNYIPILLNIIEELQTKVDTGIEMIKELKEIEKSHKEENGKLRVEFEKVYEDNLTLAHELEQEKERNNNLIKQLQEQNTEIQDISRQLRQEKEKNKELEEKCKEVVCVPEGTCFIAVPKNMISKDKIKELLENEIIDISGFRCIAVEDIENLLEDK